LFNSPRSAPFSAISSAHSLSRTCFGSTSGR
jgi:hypothetical protein